MEVKSFNIQVNTIAPGVVNTRMLEEVLAAGEAAGEAEVTQAWRCLQEGGTSPERAADAASSWLLQNRMASPSSWSARSMMGGRIGRNGLLDYLKQTYVLYVG